MIELLGNLGIIIFAIFDAILIVYILKNLVDESNKQNKQYLLMNEKKMHAWLKMHA